jgi:hypothetical protein
MDHSDTDSAVPKIEEKVEQLPTRPIIVRYWAKPHRKELPTPKKKQGDTV